MNRGKPPELEIVGEPPTTVTHAATGTSSPRLYQGVYSDPYGGFAVGSSTLPQMLQVGTEGDPTAGRTQPSASTSCAGST